MVTLVHTKHPSSFLLSERKREGGWEKGEGEEREGGREGERKGQRVGREGRREGRRQEESSSEGERHSR